MGENRDEYSGRETKPRGSFAQTLRNGHDPPEVFFSNTGYGDNLKNQEFRL